MVRPRCRPARSLSSRRPSIPTDPAWSRAGRCVPGRGRRASARRRTTTSSASPVAAAGRPCHDTDAVTSPITTWLDPGGLSRTTSRMTTQLPRDDCSIGTRSTFKEGPGAPRRRPRRNEESRRSCFATRRTSRSWWHCRASPRSPSAAGRAERELAEVGVLRHDHETVLAGM